MENEENVGAEATTENAGATEATETKKKTLNELLAEDKELQSQYDLKITNSLKTARANWEEEMKQEQKARKAEADRLAKMDEDQKKDYQLQEAIKRAEEAEKKLTARDLEAETLKQANDKGIPLDLIKTIDFEKETAESISDKLDIFEKTAKSERERIINEYSKEEAPQTGDRPHEKGLSELKTYAEFEEYYKKHPDAK